MSALGRALIIAVMLALAACFPKPLDLQVRDVVTDAPVEGVAMHRHAISLLTLLPSKQDPVITDANGDARVWVPPFNTNVTLLRPGYEPASIAVYKSDVSSKLEGAASRPNLRFDALKEGDVVSMKLKPVTRTPTTVQVVDAATGKPVGDVEVLSTTFLYLPAPGLEDGWGFPDLQDLRTSTDGGATIDCISGFRNRVTARAAGRADAQTDIRAGGPSAITMKSRELRWKPVRFEVLDEKRGTPVEGAWVTTEEPRRGLPPDPNAFAAVTGPDGLTPPVVIPDAVPLVIQIEAPGHRKRREALDWNAIGEGDIRTLWIRRKGWFE